jgi:hypothetical protein
MSSTINLQQSILWSGPYLHYQPQTIGGLEPALSNANLIKSTMLGSPFAWPWNRAETPAIACTPGTQDYTSLLPTFGHIEKAWIVLAGKITEISVKTSLSKDSTSERPTVVSVHLDDGFGHITFRLTPNPDKAYSLVVQYQQKAIVMSSMASRWDPIPDELSYIFNPGFLAMGLMITGDARFPIFNDRFVAHLLGAQDGLDDLQRNIFVGDWLNVMKQTSRAQIMPQQGIASRGK